MFILSLLLFVDGILATRTVKRDFDDGCKSSSCGIGTGVLVSSDSVSIRCCSFSGDGRIYPMHVDLLEQNFSTGSMRLLTPNLSFLT